MKHFENLLRMDLQLFADGGAEGGNGAEGTGATEAVAAPQKRASNKNPLADMQYGKQDEEVAQPTSQAPQEETITPEQLEAEFKELTKKGGKFAEQFSKATEGIVKNRLKSTKAKVDQMDALAPTLGLLAQRYGVDPGDIAALSKAIEEDNSYYETEAAARGISVEELKRIEKLERDSAMLKNMEREQEAKRRAEADLSRWIAQGEAVKTKYPGFDLRNEINNTPRFLDLLKSGVDVESAYFVCHKDDIVSGAMQYTAKTIEEKVAKSVAANAKRPNENGVSATNTQRAKKDVASLTKADRQEIARRVARGEKIRF